MCAIVILQMVLWSAHSFTMLHHNRKSFQASRTLLRKQIEATESRRRDVEDNDDLYWKGYRQLRISQLVKETDSCTSVYLKSDDGKPLPSFLPGQHLTFRFDIPGVSKPVVRCYSLSNGPNDREYRITVKSIPAPPNNPMVPAGVASNFINSSLMEGDVLKVKAPSGSFILDEKSNAPIVLLAGGIGVTPMISMMQHIVNSGSTRLVVLVVGVKNGKQHAFKEYLHQTANQHSNVHVVTCYSEPETTEQEGVDFHCSGFVSIDLVKQLLPDNKCQFYVCGPPNFMKSINDGLENWQVPPSRIFTEAFGPASLRSIDKPTPAAKAQSAVEVSFSKSGVKGKFSPTSGSLLALAESEGVDIPFGCRAGSCGTCETRIVSGKVVYPEGAKPDCPASHCLACIALPDGEIELDA